MSLFQSEEGAALGASAERQSVSRGRPPDLDIPEVSELDGIVVGEAAGTGWAPIDRIHEGPLARLLSVTAAMLILIVTAPVMLIIAALIKVGTPGPVLFVQQRLGVGGKPFPFVKFRTMYVDARERFPELYAYDYDENELNALKFKMQDDPRVTPQGQWLRSTTLDELPNFWNVLTGDMALVGPRPEIPEMLPYYKGEMREKFSLKPGVTGLAQVSGRGDLGFRETVEMDVEYVRTRSLELDIKLLWRTVVSVILRRGAY